MHAMRYEKKKAGLSPLVAVILLVAITVAAALVVSGVFFNLASIAGRRPTAAIDHIKLIVLPTGGQGAWAITLKNTGDVNMTAVTASFSGCNPGALTFSPMPVGPGLTTAASGTATGCSVGVTYRVTLTVTFQDGSQQVLVSAVTASVA
jgi:FlaG/FlaF family flagellin (archaellin)